MPRLTLITTKQAGNVFPACKNLVPAPVSGKAYDTDGYEGIYCPETAAVKGRKKVTGEVVSTAGTALSGLVGGVAGKIVRTGASLLTSASGEQSVQIASGYEFYLMEEVKR